LAGGEAVGVRGETEVLAEFFSDPEPIALRCGSLVPVQMTK
jgi:hypothetical protein